MRGKKRPGGWRPCPPDFRETYIKEGWGCQEIYGARTSVVRRWIDECGGEELVAQRMEYFWKFRAGRGIKRGDHVKGWSAERIVETFGKWNADRVVAEKNFGGAMVEAVLRTASKNLPITMVTASRGKIARAEPVAALYEQGKVSHCGTFHELEDQMCAMTGAGFVGEGSPDRADALVWALSALSTSASTYNLAALAS